MAVRVVREREVRVVRGLKVERERELRVLRKKKFNQR